MLKGLEKLEATKLSSSRIALGNAAVRSPGVGGEKTKTVRERERELLQQSVQNDGFALRYRRPLYGVQGRATRL